MMPEIDGASDQSMVTIGLKESIVMEIVYNGARDPMGYNGASDGDYMMVVGGYNYGYNGAREINLQ